MIIRFRSIIEDNGTLVPIELKDIPFKTQRVFFVCNVPKNSERGHHAHFETEQILICIKGEIIVHLYDGFKKTEIKIKPFEGIYVPKMVWDSQTYLTGEDILLSLCSTKYDKADYITDINEFEKIVREGKQNEIFN